MGRHEAYDIYAEEHVEDEATRTAEPRMPSYDDQFEDRTRSARESRAELEGLVRSSQVASSERARQAFVTPAELEGDRSPSIRARKSFVDPSELAPASARASYVEQSERRPRTSRPSLHPRASHVDRSERRSVVPSVRPPPPPAPPTPRSSRASFVASSERSDFASSVPATIPSSRPLARPPSAPSYSSDEVTSHHPSAPPVSQPVSQIASSEIEEVSSGRPVDYEQLKRFLFEEVSHDSPEAAAMSKDDRSVSMRTPVHPMLPPPPTRGSVPPAARSSHIAFRPGSVPPASIAPIARISHHAFRPQMAAMMGMPHAPTEQVVAAMNTLPFGQNAMRMSQPPQHDSYVDSSWIVPTPQYPTSQQPLQSPFKVTLSFVAATLTAIAALAVMVGAIIFIRSEEPTQAPTVSAAPPAAAQALDAPATTAPTAPAAPQASAPVVVAPEAPVAKPAASVTKATPKKKPTAKVATPTASDDESETTTVKPTKPAASATPAKKAPKDKAIEQVLADLGEEQLKR